MSLKPDYAASIEFLQKFRPEGPWVPLSIDPDRKVQPRGRSFMPGQEDQLLEWLEQEGLSKNLYFHTNATRRGLAKKALATDVVRLDCLHVDIDPRTGEDINEERTRILALLGDLPGGLPRPSVVVFSGGGYQAFWRLAEPKKLDGSEAQAEDAKLWNLQVEYLLQADNCHNIDRVMRLPGTLNRPDARKQAKGQTVQLAKVVEFNDTTYSLDDFQKAPQVQQGGEGIGSKSRKKIEISGNVQRISADWRELEPYDVTDKTKEIIVQGFDPDDPDKHSSPSEWQWYVSCELARRGVPAELHFAILTDPDYGISGTIHKKGTGAERYAIRQIEKAEEEAVDPCLRELNERHAFIANWSGRCTVIEEVYDHALDRKKLTRIPVADFRTRYSNRSIVTGEGKNGVPNLKKLGNWWLEHPQRREYDSVVFVPGKEVENCYNLWQGFGCEAVKGDCDLMLKHMREVICDGDEESYNYLLGWCAHMIQKPGEPGHIAVVLKGDPGTGKSFLAQRLGELLGRHYLQVSDPKFLVGSFNAHLRDCVLLFGDEAFWAGDKKHESVLKQLVTERMIAIESKGVDVEAASNCIHLIMASNEDWVVPVGYRDRRFFVLDVSTAQRRNRSYFEAIQEQWVNGGREAFLHMLLNYNLNEFDVRNPPETTALLSQRKESLDPIEAWWHEKLEKGRLMEHLSEWGEVLQADLQSDLRYFTQTAGRWTRGDNVALGKFLTKICPEVEKRRFGRTVEVLDPRTGQKQKISAPYYYAFPPLEECRAAWQDHFGGDWDFPPEEEAPKLEDPHDDGGGSF